MFHTLPMQIQLIAELFIQCRLIHYFKLKDLKYKIRQKLTKLVLLKDSIETIIYECLCK